MNTRTILTLLGTVLLLAAVLWFRHDNLATNVSDSNAIFTVASSSGRILFEVDNSGFVGVGKEHPSAPLEVYGAIRLSRESTDVCNEASEGQFMYNAKDKHFWGCNGSAWKLLDQ